MDGSKVLHVQKIKEPAGVTKPGRDRGVRVPLTWGDVDYEGGLGGVIIIIGKVNIPNGNGYCEVRLATAEDKPMMRFSFHSSDYRTYCYTDNRREAVNNSAANKDDPRWPTGSSDKIQYATADAVQYNTWCDFILMVDCETGTLLNYDITDNAGFHFSGEKVCQLFEFGNAVPAYAEFTAVGNGYDTNRQGAYLDDIKFVYIKPDLPWATVFVDDFSSYTVGESLTAQTDVYERIGSAPTFSDEIKNDGDGNYAYIWLGTPETGYPKDGIKYVLPEEIKPVFGGKLRFTARYFCPDNGCWTKMMNGADPVATYGFHSANRWFATWGSDDASPRYDGMENGPYNDWVTTCMTVGFDENGDAIVKPELLEQYSANPTNASYDIQIALGVGLNDVSPYVDTGVQMQMEIYLMGDAEAQAAYLDMVSKIGPMEGNREPVLAPPLNEEQTERYAELLLKVENLVWQEVDKYIKGEEPVDNWDSVIASIKPEADEMEEIYNAAWNAMMGE